MGYACRNLAVGFVIGAGVGAGGCYVYLKTSNRLRDPTAAPTCKSSQVHRVDSTLVLPSHSCRSTQLQTWPERMHQLPSGSHSLFSTLPLRELQKCDPARICL